MSMSTGLPARGQPTVEDVGIDSALIGDPRFQQLVRERSTFAWTLSAVIFVIYLAFIVLVAFAHDLMATKIAAGSEISLGIVLGLAMIILSFLVTGIYVARANTRFDALTRDVVEGRRS